MRFVFCHLPRSFRRCHALRCLKCRRLASSVKVQDSSVCFHQLRAAPAFSPLQIADTGDVTAMVAVNCSLEERTLNPSAGGGLGVGLEGRAKEVALPPGATICQTSRESPLPSLEGSCQAVMWSATRAGCVADCLWKSLKCHHCRVVHRMIAFTISYLLIAGCGRLALAMRF